MSIDIEGRLRPAGIKGNSTVYLGDVARAALRSLGPADPPFFDLNRVTMSRDGDSQPHRVMFRWLCYPTHIGGSDWWQDVLLIKSK